MKLYFSLTHILFCENFLRVYVIVLWQRTSRSLFHRLKKWYFIGLDCEKDFNNLDKKLSGYVNSSLNVQETLCEEVASLIGEKLPKFDEIVPSKYPFLTPLLKFKHIHQSVIKSVSDLNLSKAYFANKCLEISETQKGFSTIWVDAKHTYERLIENISVSLNDELNTIDVILNNLISINKVIIEVLETFDMKKICRIEKIQFFDENNISIMSKFHIGSGEIEKFKVNIQLN